MAKKRIITRTEYIDLSDYLDRKYLKDIRQNFERFIEDQKQKGIPEDAVLVEGYSWNDYHNCDEPNGEWYFEWQSPETDEEYMKRKEFKRALDYEREKREADIIKEELLILQTLKEKYEK